MSAFSLLVPASDVTSSPGWQNSLLPYYRIIASSSNVVAARFYFKALFHAGTVMHLSKLCPAYPLPGMGRGLDRGYKIYRGPRGWGIRSNSIIKYGSKVNIHEVCAYNYVLLSVMDVTQY